MQFSLPLIKRVFAPNALKQTLPFAGYNILAVQHLLGASLPFFDMFEKGGVKPSDIHLIGKAYSSHPLIINQLQKRGYHLSFDDIFYNDTTQPYETILENRIAQEFQKLHEKMSGKQKWLIIDDGAKAIKLLHKRYRSITGNFTCVEQTSRGSRVVNSLDLLCPVIDVARSKTKTILEAPMIAESMVEEFVALLKQWQRSKIYRLADNKVLLLGYGFIGESVAPRLLKHGFDVVIHDPDSDRMLQASLKGLTTIKSLEEVYKKISVLVGCSGTQVIPEEDFAKLKNGTMIVNMASTDTEFSSWKLRARGKIIYQNILASDLQYLKAYMPLPWRSLYEVSLDKDKYFYLANGGFPIDFCGKINPVPLKDIQLTSSLLFAGSLQAVQVNQAGFVELDLASQDKIVAEFLRLKGRKS
jgi:hypothetical protein